MDRIEHLRASIQCATTASDYYRYPPHGRENLFACDDERAIYTLYNIGWRGREHVFRVRLILRIKEGKIWIDEDWTEKSIVTEQLRLGVSSSAIVQAWMHPDLRETPEPLLTLSTA
jgi:hypothetical protein